MKYYTIPFVLLMAGATALAAEEPTMQSLFNGKNLEGWTGEGYVVEDGTIVCTPTGKNLTTVGTYSNYVLDFEFKLPPGGNSGIGIHYPGTGGAAHTGMEIQILDNTADQYKDLKPAQYHGSLYLLAPAEKRGLKPVGEWNRERISVLGPKVTVELNGETILKADLDELAEKNPDHPGVQRRAGHIALLGHDDAVAFRNIQIVEAPPAANIEGVKAAGFHRLFNGKNLDGWKHGNNPEWTVSNGILKHSGRRGDPADLWTEKEYADCMIAFDWRWSGRGPQKDQPIIDSDGSTKLDSKGKPMTVEIEELDSGIYLRGSSKSQVNIWNWPIGSGEVYGYRTDSSMPAEVRAGVTPKTNADRAVGEWNRMLVTIKGDRLTVALNGRVVIENAQLPGIPDKGPVGLQHHGAAIDFANIWIKEL